MHSKIRTLGLICLLVLGSVLFAEKKAPPNPWQQLFTEPFEIAYVIMKDRITFTYTSGLENEVYISIGKLEKKLKKMGYKIEDIVVVIHNHLTDYKFSPRDYKMYRRLKKYGFKGHFLLYSHMTNKTYDIEDGKKSN